MKRACWDRFVCLLAVLTMLPCLGAAARSGPADVKTRALYVSPEGKADARGTEDDPFDLQTVLNGPEWLKPGTTVRMLGGEYRGEFRHEKSCSGTREQPLVFRVAKNARATIVGGLRIYGSHTRFIGFEITNPNAVEVSSFFNFYGGDNCAAINLILHHNGAWHPGRNGIGCWSAATNSEVYGCLVYNVGRKSNPKDRGSGGHGIYTQNIRGTGTKRIEDNIFFNATGWGIHAYGSAKAGVSDYTVRRNLFLRNGGYGALVGGGAPSKDIVFEDNCLYGNASIACAMGLGGSGSSGLSFSNNYVAGSLRSRLLLQMRRWKDGTVEGNTFCCLEAGPPLGVLVPDDWELPAYQWNRNRYFMHKTFSSVGHEPRLFALVGRKYQDFEGWRKLGFDRDSSLTFGKPPKTTAFVLPNRHQAGRGHVAVFNWEHTPSVELDLSKVLVDGERFIILDAQDYFGKPLADGTWRGGKVNVPLPKHDPAPEFAALVVLSGESVHFSCRGEAPAAGPTK